MAIVDMQRLQALTMKRDHTHLLQFLQRAGCVQLIPVEVDEGQAGALNHEQKLTAEDTQNRIKWTISRLSKYDAEKQSMFKPLPLAPREALEADNLISVLQVVEQVEELMRRSGEKRGSETRLEQLESQLIPWLNLDIPADELKATATTRVLTGSMPNRKLNDMISAWEGRPVSISQLSNISATAYFLAVVHKSVVEEFLQDLRAAGYTPAAPQTGKLTPKDQMNAIQQDRTALEDEEKAIEEQLRKLAVHLPDLRLAFEALSAKKARLQAQETMAHTHSVSMLEGWIPKPSVEPLLDAMRSEFPTTQVLVSDPTDADDPPVLLQNNAMVRPYEAVVEGFALPKNGTMDPTPAMMPFFACFFGMMVSDAGYGLMMALLIPILVKILKPSEGARKIFWILCGGGVATLFWGAMYNTWFGFSPWPSVFDPVNNSLPVMGLCIGVGALHLFAGLMVGAVQNFKNKDPMSAVYDQFSWIALIVGLGLLLLPQTKEIGKWMAIISAGIILVTAGREKSNNPIKRLISGFGALYNITGWISDLLSYMRLFGMGLATGVIGMVINRLVGMLTSSGIIGMVIGAVVFVGAHLFNAAINTLGAYVHSCRLQYIEFFGKFYEEGGKPFKPLRFAPRYVRIHE